MANSQNKHDLNLERLIAAYVDARAAWLNTAASNTDLVSGGEYFEEFETTAHAILSHPCLTLDAIRCKILFILGDPDLYTMVREDEDDSGDLLRVFLASLISGVQESKPRL